MSPYFGPLGRSLATWRDSTPRPGPDCAMVNRNSGNIAIPLGAARPVFYAPAYCIQCRWSWLRTIPIVDGPQFDTDSNDLFVCVCECMRYVQKMSVVVFNQSTIRPSPHQKKTNETNIFTYQYHFARPTVSRVSTTGSVVGPWFGDDDAAVGDSSSW